MASRNKGDSRRDKSPANPPAGASCSVCKEPDDSRMVACDRCAKWFHFACVEEDSGVADRDWSCSECAEVPPKPSTNTGTKPKTGSTKINELGPDDSLQRQVAEMQKKLDKQMKEFERSMKEKDEQRRKALKEQQNKFDQELERRMREQKDAYQTAAAAAFLHGSGRTSAAIGGSQAASSPALGGSQAAGLAAFGGVQAAGPSKGSAAVGGLAPGSFGDIPAASSTGIFNSQASGISSAEILAQELQLLEEKQELERRHLEEKNQFLQRIAALGGGAADGNSGLNPQANSFRQGNPTGLGYSLLSQSQVSARQAVNKELPAFSGNPEEWPLFFASYENSTRICGFSDEENLLRLQRSLRGRALEAVRCRLLHPSNLAGVIATLKTLYGRPEIIVHSLVTKIREMPAPKAEKLNTLIDFGVAVQNVCATIKASGLDEYLCNVALLQELTERLPPAIRLNWAYHRQTLQRVTLSDFGDWLGKLVEAASVVTIPPIGCPKAEKRGRKEDNYLNVHSDGGTSEEAATKTRSPVVPKGCIVCREECSGLETCRKFLNMDIGARWTVIKEQRLCRKCLRKHFGACHVKTACGKNGCSFMHSKLLHDDKRYNKPPTTEPTASTSSSGNSAQSCNAHSDAANKILFRYVPVTLIGKGRTVNTFAFLDDGSSATFMEHSLVKELDLEGTSHPLCLNWTGGQQREENESVKLSLKISGTHDSSKVYELPKVHTVQNLSLPKQSVSVKKLESKYSYLRGLPLESYDNVSPRILIGIDNCRLGHALRSAEGSENEPVATKTRLGWLVCGPCSTASGAANVGYSSYHSFHICPCSTETDKELDGALKEYFSIESMGITGSSKSPVSRDEERAMDILSSKTCLKGNRYETGLLWRYDEVKLPDSRAMAVRRLACLEKRMNRDPELAAAVRAKMADLEAKGYIRKLSESEKAERHPNDWYLPIFPVINPNKPGKIRLVMDAAAKVNGVSLNSFLLTGPDQLVSLLTVLFRFREFRFAVVGDIREMFFQVLMGLQDQRSQMILWNGGNSGKEPDVYAVTVMTFGAACSPSSAHYVKNLNADRFAEQFPRAVESIKYEHYVDDMLSSVETEDEAVQLAKDVRYVHSQAGFEIRNWQSNSSKVMAALQEGTTSEKDLSLCTETTSKVLGMWWNIASDTFTFRLSPKHDAELLSGSRMPTKREVLRTLMAIYDPMGLIGNFLMYLKILLQEIWRSGSGWDDQISGKLAEKWMTWITVLPDVRKVSVPRCYRLNTSVKADVQLHVFCDASENGFAAVAYFRFEEDGVVECAMVGSKTRVAPLKFLSIPRLELQAAVLGARLADTIASAHRMKISRRVFWTDSRDVVCWIRSDHRRYSSFVAFRVSELLETTTGDAWRWVPTKSNVADDGTKWQKLPDLEPTSRWFCGPDFLRKPESEWPGEGGDPGTTTEEIRPSVLHHTITEPLVCFERFSKWKRLLRTVAYVHRFVGNLRNRLKQTPAELGPLTQEELIQAEHTIYRQVQRQAYPDEVQMLSSVDPSKQPWERTLPKTSSLFKLSPAIDAHGVLRMQGRIEACEWVDESVKRPILLPKRHYVTSLVIADYHAKYRHQNHQTVKNELKLKYNIPRLGSEFDRVRRNCQHCKINQAKPQPPAMGNHPSSRLAAFQRPFSYTGIDYFGPMTVVVGRRPEKRWGVLLTCLTTRAVHIELAHSLTTDSCILALRNFIARRGPPLEIISDRGTNFVGASRELREALKAVDEKKLMTTFVGPNTTWKFNPPAAPHFGGCWERLVQSVKKILKDFKPPRLPTDEILRSMLMEIEMIINSRPLTHLSLETDSEPPLTPNHFLLGSSNGSKPPIAFDDRPAALKQSWRMSQQYADEFWRKWVFDYMPTLTRRTKWFQPTKPIEVGSLALIVDEDLPRNCWPRGRVVDVVHSSDGQVRRVVVQTANGGLLERPAIKVAVLDVGLEGSKPPRNQRRTGGECYTPAACGQPSSH